MNMNLTCHESKLYSLFMQLHRATAKYVTAFWKKVNIGLANECWEWKASIEAGSLGYGSFGNTLAHRASWNINKGEIPKGMQVLHRCDNPKCVNPLHLFLGTQADNIHDCMAKGRMCTCSPIGARRRIKERALGMLN